MRRYGIQIKIVLPFLLLFACVTVIVPLITVEFFAWKYSEQFTRETQGWLDVILKTGYIQEETEKIKHAYSAEVMIFGSDYTLNANTLGWLSNQESDWQNLAQTMRLNEVKQQLQNPDAPPVTRDITLVGKPYKVFYRLLPRGRFYCFLRPMEKIAEAKRALTFYMFGIGVLVMGAVALISHLIGRNLTIPLKRLVEFTKRVALGELNQACDVQTHDEIGDLASAFNTMTQELQESRDKLVQAERLAMAGKMSASFAHEIRNPLSSMRMLAQMLIRKTDMPEERMQQSLRYILQEIERIDGIVKGLMDFARPTTLNLVQQSLEQALRAVLELMEANLAHHQIRLVSEFTPEPPEIAFDSEKLKQAFMNVVLNAMEAMPRGGTLTVAIVKKSDSMGIKVADTGVGIPAEERAHLFEPFFTRKAKGTGLGLANVKRVLEEHGGNVEIESTIGKGTTVLMWLPIAISPAGVTDD